MAIVVGTRKEKAPRIPVTFGYMRDDEFETIELQAVAALDAAGMRRALVASQRESPDMLDALFATVAKMLDNTDGVPHGWKPRLVHRARGGAITEDAELAADSKDEASFRVPYGDNKNQIVPMSELPKYLDPKTWSSRARWNYLITEDEGAVVDAGDVTKLFEQMVGAAANRPTVASS